jgi:hypothetical protein
MINIKSWINEDCTLGRLEYEDFHCFTLELPWRENNKNISCIPPGEYEATKYDSPKHGDVILLLEVDGRDMIEIHSGNYTRQILGCILVGDSIKYLDGDSIPDVTNSKATLAKLMGRLPDVFKINIERA